MKALSLTTQKLKVFEKWVKLPRSRSQNFVPKERSYDKEHTYESPITYHSKDMANVKVFADRQAKNYMPRSFDKGHKNLLI
jgi:hypothetical protein